MDFRWNERQISEQSAVDHVQSELNGIHAALARALVLRGIDSYDRARRFFRPSMNDGHDPFLMADMQVAAERVAAAITHRERVVVYGDYDVDGTTATALFVTFLRDHGVPTEFFVPHRIEHGYGLNRAGIDFAADDGATLVVALDCGVTAIDEASYARAKGIDLVICDHHKVKGDLPDALAVLDPKRPDCEYPFQELSGCGIGFKLVQATLTVLGEPVDAALPLLDLVAVSVASDIVPLHGENRILMQQGLATLRESPRLGFRALARESGTDLSTCSTGQIVFSIGPRINAAGRLGDAGRAVELMLASDESLAATMAAVLEATNLKRRTIDRETADQAVTEAESMFDRAPVHGIVLHNPTWHPGVIGIVASRVVERFARPAILLTTINGIAKGSARSIPGLNIFEAIRSCEDLLEEFGGHDFAAGLSIKPENITLFASRFNEAVRSMSTDDMFVPTMDYDANLQLSDVDSRFWAVLRQFEPHGPTNDTPVFRSSALRVLGRPRTIGRGSEHLKFVVRQADSRAMEVIGFGMADRLGVVEDSRETGAPLEMLYSIEENVWQGRRSLQLRARDVRLEA